MKEMTINVVKLGESGPALLALHGWGQNLEKLRPFGELLADSFQVHLLDLPGFGNSEIPNSDWDTLQYAERILSYIDEQNLKNVSIIGHSFGGKVGIRIAAQHPELVKNLVLVASSGLKINRSPHQQLKFKAISYLGKILKWLKNSLDMPLYESWFMQRFASSDYKNAGPLRNILVKSLHEDLSDDARKIQAKTLLIWGECDTASPPDIGKRFHALIPNSKLLLLPEKDHFLFDNAGFHLMAYYIKPFLN